MMKMSTIRVSTFALGLMTQTTVGMDYSDKGGICDNGPSSFFMRDDAKFQGLCQKFEEAKKNSFYQDDVKQDEEFTRQKSEWMRLGYSWRADRYVQKSDKLGIPSKEVMKKTTENVVSQDFSDKITYLNELAGGYWPGFGIAYHAEIDMGRYTHDYCEIYPSLHRKIACEDSLNEILKGLRPFLVGEIIRNSASIQKEQTK